MQTDDYAVKVVRIQQQSIADHFGMQQPVITVTYTVGAHGPFTESFPKATYDPNTVKQILQAQQEKIRAMTM